MTIEAEQHQRDTRIPAVAVEGEPRRGWLFVGIVAFGVIATLGGLTLVGLDIALENSHFAVYAAACFVLAGISGALVCFRAMLADRREFYRRGQLDGWMKGWRGQEPDVDDPLLK